MELLRKQRTKVAEEKERIPFKSVFIRRLLFVFSQGCLLFLASSLAHASIYYHANSENSVSYGLSALDACSAHVTMWNNASYTDVFTSRTNNNFGVCKGVYNDALYSYATYHREDDVCPAPYVDNGSGYCVEEQVEPELKLDHKQPVLPSCSTSAPPNPVVADPIIVATGNSFQTENDYQSQKPFGLNFVRYYSSSSNAVDKGVGNKWSHGFNRAIKVEDAQAQVARSNGQTFLFNFDGSVWVGDVDISDTLVETVDSNDVRTGWVYTDSRDNVETFNANGQLLSITNRAGQSQSFVYNVAAIDGGDDDNDTLDKVTGFGGETLLLSYDSDNRITTMTDPEGNEYIYDYDAAGNLTSVTYPDNTPLDTTDNPVRTYHYENTTYPSHLTGLTDETGSRVTWDFDSEGRAISSELDGGVDKSTLDFSVADQVTVTNPLGKDTTYHFTTLHGVKKVTQVEGHATASCVGANQNYTYDANGYLASKTDWQGNVTTYVHDERGLETSRTEASGTVQSRTITTEWHSDFRLPTKITFPGQVTDFVYDTQGRLISKTSSMVQP